MGPRSARGLSALEEDYEIQMESDEELNDEDSDHENDDSEIEFELNDNEADDETDGFEVDDDELDDELNDSEGYADEVDRGNFARRLYEISTQNYETTAESDQALDEVINDMEREYFFGGLKRLAKKAIKSPAFKVLLKQAVNLAGNHPAFAALKGLTALTSGNLKGMLKSAANMGLQAVPSNPAAAAALAAIKGLDINSEGEFGKTEEAWESFVDMSRESFEYLARNLSPAITNPIGASRLAANALQAGIRNTKSRAPTARYVGRKKRRVIYLRKGERLLIVRR